MQNKIVRFLYQLKIRKQVLLAMVIISVCSTIFLGTIVYSFSKFIIEKNYKQTYTDNLQVSSNITDMQLDTFIELMRAQLINTELTAIFHDAEEYSDTKVFSSVDNLKLGKILGEMAGQNDKIEGISLISTNGKSKFYYKRVKSGTFEKYYGDENILTNDWVKEADEAEGKETFYSYDVLINKITPYISITKKLINPSTGDAMGYMVVSIRQTLFDRAFGTIGNKNRANSYLVIDRYASEPVVYYNGSTEDQHVIAAAYLSTSSQHSKYVFSSSINKTTGWEMVNVIAKSELNKDSLYIGGIIILAIILLIFFSIFISNLIATRIYLPLSKLENVIEKVGEGERHIDEEFDDTEIGLIGEKFKKMVNNNLELSEQLLSAELKEREAELLLLQSQINPHFLYNTLDSIYCMAIIDDNINIAEMVASLSNIFKLSLNKGNKYIKIEDELSHIKEYMFIQNIRYNNRFELIFAIDEAIKNHYMIKFILQPFVENGVYHGLEPKIGGGFIKVTGKFVGEDIQFTIEDNGVGMSDLNAVERGYGVKNVRERIRLFYGEAYGLSYSSVYGEGTKVEILIPSCEMPKGADYEETGRN